MTSLPPTPPTTQTPSQTTTQPGAADWAAARGEKWLSQLAGMEATLAPVDEPLIRALQLNTPGRIADIGCGGGGTSWEIGRRAPAGSVVHGFDVSPALVERARQRAFPTHSEVGFTTADMATETAPAALYDRLVSRFGIMFFDNPPAAFANLLRWLVPGGRFAFAAWGRPADNAWLQTVREVVAGLVDVPAIDPEAPGPFRYGESDRLLRLLTQVGFGELDVQAWRGELPIGGALSPAGAANFGLSAFSSFGELLAQAGAEALH